MPDQPVGQIADRQREVVVADMARAGQALAVQWGHQPWSDSWAHLVAETLLEAYERCPACGDLRFEGDHYECFTGEPRDSEPSAFETAWRVTQRRSASRGQAPSTGSGDRQ